MSIGAVVGHTAVADEASPLWRSSPKGDLRFLIEYDAGINGPREWLHHDQAVLARLLDASVFNAELSGLTHGDVVFAADDTCYPWQ